MAASNSLSSSVSNSPNFVASNSLSHALATRRRYSEENGAFITFLRNPTRRLRGPLLWPAGRCKEEAPGLMSPQRMSARHGPRRADRACKEHRRCHRLGDDFVGPLLQPTLRREQRAQSRSPRPSKESALWIRPRLLAAIRQSAPSDCRRRRGHLGRVGHRGGLISSASKIELGGTVRPTSCGCQEANTTYCYFTTRIPPEHTRLRVTAVPPLPRLGSLPDCSGGFRPRLKSSRRVAASSSQHGLAFPPENSTLGLQTDAFNAYSRCSHVDCCAS